MVAIVRSLLAKFEAPPILVFPDWDAVNRSRPFRLHCDASTAGLGGTLKKKQGDCCVLPIVYISHPILENEQNWVSIEPDAWCFLCSIRHFAATYAGRSFFRRSIFTSHYIKD